MLMSKRFSLFSLAVAAGVCAAGLGQSQAQAASTPIFSFYAPGSWSVGSTGSTYQEWTADPSDSISGVPNVGYNDAGAGLTQPSLAASGAFVAGSGGYYSFSGDYTAYTTIQNHDTTPPAGVGTHVIVQGFSTLNGSPSLFPITVTDSAGNPIPGATQLRFNTYGYNPSFSSSIGTVAVEAVIAEFWLPSFTDDFKVTVAAKVHSSLQGLRIDSKIAPTGSGGSSPFAITAVPEPGCLTVLAGLTGLGLLRRRF